MIRYHRMKGESTLWLPGADHAGFETQVVYQKKLEKEGRNWFQIPRAELYQEIWDFTQANKKIMERQLRKLGASCDWSRAKFTLDPEVIKIVYATFKRMHDDGLVYQDNRIVNWCTKHQTTLSDLEIKHVERQDPLYYIKYGPVTLATVRLETKFGDTALAVHPRDKRYKHLVGKEIEIKTLLGPAMIKVIADTAVDLKFGTGAVKVTPAHDPNDFEIWKRHQNEIPGPRAVIDQFGRMELLSRWPENPQAKKYHGLKILEARKAMEADMQAEGLIEKIDETYKHSVATCYKCGSIVEPRILPQWYIRMTTVPHAGNPKSETRNSKSLRDMAMEAVKNGEVKFVTKRFEKIFMHWMKNLRDWNISRQIVWGIRMPVWYCASQDYKSIRTQEQRNRETEKQNNKRMGEHVIVSVEGAPKSCPECGNTNLEQESDVFDTWFSSGQWPFAALLSQRGENSKSEILRQRRSSLWPRNPKLRIDIPVTKDFEEFYSTTVMETGWDIIFFWVARMVMFGKYVTGKVPFKYVYLHGLVRDKDRQKMSKSRSNVIDPLGVIDLYGTDALRLALIIGNTAGNDIIISEEKIRGYRNFANKLWNIARFVLMNLDDNFDAGSKPKLGAEDKKILKDFNVLIKKVTKHLDTFEFHHAGEELYHYLWHEFADKIVEAQKPRLQNTEARVTAQYLLYTILADSLKLLHPFMPFITETIWQELPKGKKDSLLMVSSWPSA